MRSVSRKTRTGSASHSSNRLRALNVFALVSVVSAVCLWAYAETDWLHWLFVDRADQVPMELLLREPTITVYQQLDDASAQDWVPMGSVGWEWDFPWQEAPDGIRVSFDSYWERDGVFACGSGSVVGWELSDHGRTGGGSRPAYVFFAGDEREGTFQFVMDYEIWNGHPGHGTLLLRNELRSEPLHVVASVAD